MRGLRWSQGYLKKQTAAIGSREEEETTEAGR